MIIHISQFLIVNESSLYLGFYFVLYAKWPGEWYSVRVIYLFIYFIIII